MRKSTKKEREEKILASQIQEKSRIKDIEKQYGSYFPRGLILDMSKKKQEYRDRYFNWWSDLNMTIFEVKEQISLVRPKGDTTNIDIIEQFTYGK